MENQREALRKVAGELSKEVLGGMTLGLGSGSTVSALLEELSPLLTKRKVVVRGVPTSTQIELVARRSGIELVAFSGTVDMVIDGADQIDRELNLVKGGGGALLREKVVMGSAKRIAIVASEEKFAGKLCENGVRIPIETIPMARESVRQRLSGLGSPQERLLPKGYPFFTENGNMIFDIAIGPIANPRAKEVELRSIPGVMEVGIFTFKPITVFKLKGDGSFERLKSN
jgi:ribose 5-phosphate isomerase A